MRLTSPPAGGNRSVHARWLDAAVSAAEPAPGVDGVVRAPRRRLRAPVRRQARLDAQRHPLLLEPYTEVHIHVV